MSLTDNMATRIKNRGGKNQQKRMNKGKLNALRKALLYSYQAATAVVGDREFRCLINPKNYGDNNIDKIISIPYEDICINEDSIYEHGKMNTYIRNGSTFEWKETKSHWIVYYQFLEETAYFRGACRLCSDEIEVGDKKYWVYLRGPNETELIWNTKNSSGTSINTTDLNYSLRMYITKDDNTEAFFHRHAMLKIRGKQYRVSAVDNITNDSVIDIYLEEAYQNSILDKTVELEADDAEEENTTTIVGTFIVRPYDSITFTNSSPQEDGVWSVENKKLVISSQTNESVSILVNTGRSGTCKLYYKYGETTIEREITIKSLV